MEKTAKPTTKSTAREGDGERGRARATTSTAPVAGNLALQGLIRRDPLAAFAGFLKAGGTGGDITTFERATVEAGTNRSLAPARVHQGPMADAILAGLGARGATAGRHILLADHLKGSERASVLRHELGHVAQAGGRAPEPGRALRLGRAASATEHQARRLADSTALGATLPLIASDANTVRLDRCPGGCHEPSPAPKVKWDFEPIAGPGVPVKTPRDILAEQPKTIAKELQGYEENILATRSSIFDQLEKDRKPATGPYGFTLQSAWTERLPIEGNLPVDLKKRYAAAEAAAAMLQAGIKAGDVTLETQDDARGTIKAYYLALDEFAVAVGKAQIERDQLMRTTREQEEARLRAKRPPPCPNCHTPTAPPQLLLTPTPPPLSPVPAQMAKQIPTMTATLTDAKAVDQWKQVVTDVQGSINAMDALLVALLPEFSKEAEQLRYLKTQKVELEKFHEEHPGAVPIPAVFYPKDRFVEEKVPGKPNVTLQIPQSIPWRFYLYHTSEKTKATGVPGEWVLVDMTSPRHYTNKSATLVPGESLLDPPLALFKQLDTKYRFPEGMLYWTYPSGQPGTLETTEPATASDWLGWIGMALAAIALIAGTVATFGLAAPATVPALTAIGVAAGIGAAGFNIASTVVGMQEKKQYGLLTEEDKEKAVLSIAFDIISALSLGLGRLAMAAEAGAQAATTGAKVSAFATRLAALNGRYFFMISRAAHVMKGVGLAADATQLLTTTMDFIKAFNAIRAQPGLSDIDRDKALVKLISTSLLTGTLLTIAVRGGIKDMKGGTLHMSGIDEKGRVVVAGEEGVLPHGKTGAVEPSAPRTVQSHLDAPGGELQPGWSRKKVGPQIDPALPEGRVEVRVLRDESGRIIGAETYHHPNADVDSIKIHEDIASLVRTEGEELRNLVHSQRQAYGGEPPPIELQLELKKLFDEVAVAEKRLATGNLSKGQAKDVKDKLGLLQVEIDKVKAAYAQPWLRSAYPPGVVGLPVKPTTLPKRGKGGAITKPPDLPEPPAGHMYYLRDDGSFGIRPKAGHVGAKFGLEEIDGKFIASNRQHIDTDYGGRTLTPKRQAELEALGYVFQSNGVIRRPPGHAQAGKPRMVPLEVDAQNRIQIVEGTETLGEMQARLRESLSKTQLKKVEKLEAAAATTGEKVVMVEGMYDTGVTWKKVLTPAKRAQLKGVLKKEGMPEADIDRLIDNLVNKEGTLKVVLGTDPVRAAAPYRGMFAEAHGAPGKGVEVHHGDPLYLGGGHDPADLFGIKTDPHDALHGFFDDLTLPANSPLGATRLQPGVIQNKVKSMAKPAAAVINPQTGEIRYEPLK